MCDVVELVIETLDVEGPRWCARPAVVGRVHTFLSEPG
jgi:hypothetical protein